MELVLLIVGIILDVACLAALGFYLHKFCKSRPLGGSIIKVEGKDRLVFLGLVIGQGLLTILSSFGAIVFNNWTLDAGRIVLLVFGSLLFGSGLSLFISSFVLYFFRKDLVEKQRNIARILMVAAIPTFIIGLWMLTDAFAAAVAYPLANGFEFGNIFSYPNIASTNFTIKFYGLLIVAGACISYFIGDHYVYVKYGKHGLLDTLFLVAFPMGIVGARLWYCLVLEPEKTFSGQLNIFAIWNGGLAIQGGAILGILTGVLFVAKFRKYINIRWLADVAIPTILIAQAVGRWGNFFNQEVYGTVSDINAWWFLPQMIRNNMVIDGSFRVPLFLIESVINVSGYFIIRYAIGRPLKKFLRQGDQAAMYLIWYGLVRVALEPLREGFTLNLGSSAAFGYLQSWITAFSMVAVGILIMVGIRIFEKVRRDKGKEVKEYEAI